MDGYGFQGELRFISPVVGFQQANPIIHPNLASAQHSELPVQKPLSAVEATQLPSLTLPSLVTSVVVLRHQPVSNNISTIRYLQPLQTKLSRMKYYSLQCSNKREKHCISYVWISVDKQNIQKRKKQDYNINYFQQYIVEEMVSKRERRKRNFNLMFP